MSSTMKWTSSQPQPQQVQTNLSTNSSAQQLLMAMMLNNAKKQQKDQAHPTTMNGGGSNDQLFQNFQNFQNHNHSQPPANLPHHHQQQHQQQSPQGGQLTGSQTGNYPASNYANTAANIAAAIAEINSKYAATLSQNGRQADQHHQQQQQQHQNNASVPSCRSSDQFQQQPPQRKPSIQIMNSQFQPSHPTPPKGESNGGGSKSKNAEADNGRRPALYRAKFKTQLCRNLMLTGACAFGEGCAFAHNPCELRPETETKKSQPARMATVLPLLKGTSAGTTTSGTFAHSLSTEFYPQSTSAEIDHAYHQEMANANSMHPADRYSPSMPLRVPNTNFPFSASNEQMRQLMINMVNSGAATMGSYNDENSDGDASGGGGGGSDHQHFNQEEQGLTLEECLLGVAEEAGRDAEDEMFLANIVNDIVPTEENAAQLQSTDEQTNGMPMLHNQFEDPSTVFHPQPHNQGQMPPSQRPRTNSVPLVTHSSSIQSLSSSESSTASILAAANAMNNGAANSNPTPNATQAGAALDPLAAAGRDQKLEMLRALILHMDKMEREIGELKNHVMQLAFQE